MKRSFSNLLLGALLLVLAAPGCDGEQSNGGNSETHFLNSCTGACANGLECICGVCTKTCEDSSACTVFSAAAECAAACSEAGVTGVCDLSCTADDECVAAGKTLRCSDGRCREPNASGNAGTTGASGGSGAAGAGGSAAESAGATAAGGAGDGGGGSSASGASAGEGGATPGAGGGSAGSTEAGGTGGDAGGSGPLDANCGAAPNLDPMLLPRLDLDPDTISLAAIVIGSCLPDDGIPRNAEHIWNADLTTRFTDLGPQAECFANARCGCAAVEHCLAVELSVSGTCASTCTGDVWSYCGPDFDLAEGYRQTIDCGRLGLACVASAGCVARDSVACDTEGATNCAPDGRGEICDDGSTLRSAVCADYGLTCEDGACVASGAACASGSIYPPNVEFEGTGCDGDILQACVGERAATLDCTTRGAGFHCQTIGDAAFCGLAAECLPYTAVSGDPASCNGDVLEFCNAGRLEAVDCLSLGFAGCGVENGDSICTPGFRFPE